MCRLCNLFLSFPPSFPLPQSLQTSLHRPFFFRPCLAVSLVAAYSILPLLLIILVSWFSLFVKTISTLHSFPHPVQLNSTFALRISRAENKIKIPRHVTASVNQHQENIVILSHLASFPARLFTSRLGCPLKKCPVKSSGPSRSHPDSISTVFNHCIFYARHRIHFSGSYPWLLSPFIFLRPSKVSSIRSSLAVAHFGAISHSTTHQYPRTTTLTLPCKTRARDREAWRAGHHSHRSSKSGFDFTVWYHRTGALGHRIVLTLFKSSSRQPPTDPLGLEPVSYSSYSASTKRLGCPRRKFLPSPFFSLVILHFVSPRLW